LTKKELIELIIQIRPKADAYEYVCNSLGISDNIIGYIKAIRASISLDNAEAINVEDLREPDEIQPKPMDEELIEIPSPRISDFVIENGNGTMFLDGMYYHFAEVIRLLKLYKS
jgi:hypothetical protein